MMIPYLQRGYLNYIKLDTVNVNSLDFLIKISHTFIHLQAITGLYFRKIASSHYGQSAPSLCGMLPGYLELVLLNIISSILL